VNPAAWLVANAALIPRGGVVLDVACGTGRHTLFLAERGWRVHAVDRDDEALEQLRRVAQSRQLEGVTTACVDLESGVASLGAEGYDAVIVFNYLHRPLMPAIVGALRPRGVLIYETFTMRQAERGGPRNPEFLLRDGELPSLVAPLRVIRAREGDYDGKLVASVVAVKD
jgi:SAM-dependent methyltransferase